MNITLARNSGDVNIDSVHLLHFGVDTTPSGSWVSEFSNRTVFLFLGSPEFFVYHNKFGEKQVATGKIACQKLWNKCLMAVPMTY